MIIDHISHYIRISRLVHIKALKLVQLQNFYQREGPIWFCNNNFLACTIWKIFHVDPGAQIKWYLRDRLVCTETFAPVEKEMWEVFLYILTKVWVHGNSWINAHITIMQFTTNIVKKTLMPMGENIFHRFSFNQVKKKITKTKRDFRVKSWQLENAIGDKHTSTE